MILRIAAAAFQTVNLALQSFVDIAAHAESPCPVVPFEIRIAYINRAQA